MLTMPLTHPSTIRAATYAPRAPGFGSGPHVIPGPNVAGMETPGAPVMSYGGDDRLEPVNPTSLTEIIAGLPTMSDTKVKTGMFDRGGTGWVLGGILADALAKGFGGEGQFAPTYLAQQEAGRQEKMWREKVAAERAERLDTADLMLQRQIGLEQWKQANKAPSDMEAYAGQFGQPGTPEYQEALRDFQLREYGPTALGAKRSAQARDLSARDQMNRRTTATSQANTLRTQAGLIRRQGAQQAFELRNPKGKSGARSSSPRTATIVNPQTGKRMRLEGGKWVPAN